MVYVRDRGEYLKVFFDGKNGVRVKFYYKAKPFTKKEEIQIFNLCNECNIAVDWGYLAIKKIKKSMNPSV